MTPTLGDVLAVIRLASAAPAEAAALTREALRRARAADAHRRRWGRVHPLHGDGSLAAAAGLMAMERSPPARAATGLSLRVAAEVCAALAEDQAGRSALSGAASDTGGDASS